ncbi:MAG: radical SAM protein [Candidatus Omnitrophota bacterium]|nr:MAG: radical SAM protein [Candidatus Omnitrophota bacterium]
MKKKKRNIINNVRPKKMSYFYGPVPSRRLGFSLGVDIVPKKLCTFDCVYCQIGRTTKKSTRRISYVDFNVLERELRDIIRKSPKIDYITISGSGEPTLHKDLDKIILTIKRITRGKLPVCVITNSSLLYREDVRNELKGADLIIPSLDAATSKTFKMINRAQKGIGLKHIIDGLIKLRREFKGKIWLEIMLLGGINDTLREAEKFKGLIKKLKPDKVQLNLPVRPPAAAVALPSSSRVNEIKKILDGNIEIVASSLKARRSKLIQSTECQILNFLKRRPAHLDDLKESLGLNSYETMKSLKKLVKNNKIKAYIYRKKKYFVTHD